MCQEACAISEHWSSLVVSAGRAAFTDRSGSASGYHIGGRKTALPEGGRCTTKSSHVVTVRRIKFKLLHLMYLHAPPRNGLSYSGNACITENSDCGAPRGARLSFSA